MAEQKPDMVEDYPCPNCGSTKTWLDEAYKFKRKEGKVPALAEGGSLALQPIIAQPLTNPALAVASVPTLIPFEDICFDCGTRHIKRVVLQMAPIKVMPLGTDKGFGFPPESIKGHG